jgi:8-oxo-dGTP diphosphatase
MSPAPLRRPVHVVAAALVRTTPHPRVFVARRSPDKRHGGLWELPGGQVEPGESERDALRRELQEELGILATPAHRLGEATVSTGSIDVRMVVFIVTDWTGTIALVDHDDSRWVGSDDLPTIDWAPADLPHLPALARVLRQA